MEIPKNDLRTWRKKKRHGIIEEIAKFTGLNRRTVSSAYKGTAAPETIEKINSFFNQTVRS